MKIVSTVRKFFTSGFKLLSLLGITIFQSLIVQGQAGVFIANGENVHINSEDTAAFYENVRVEGVLSTASNSAVLFYGKNWDNQVSSRFPGNGDFIFTQPSSLGQNDTQLLGGVNWSNRFPNMVLSNAKSVKIVGVAGVRDSFVFDTGYVVLNKHDFVIGEGHSGAILNYDDSKFFITTNSHSSDSGFLVRHNVDSGNVDFPVGNGVLDYNPARLTNRGTVDTFSVRVFKNVYDKGDSGQVVSNNVVNRTWNILENTPGGSSVTLTLQHNVANEGSNYNRNEQYVARYFGQSNNAYLDTSDGSFWDYASPVNSYANVSGAITTGSASGFMSTRSTSISSDFSRNAPTRYFTKASSSAPLPVELLYFTAAWEDLNEAHVKWSTASELNNKEFQLYRSYDNVNYELVNVQRSLADNGNSNAVLAYDFMDFTINPNESEVYYRLLQVDYDNSNSEYGPIMITKQNRNDVIVSAYPNPSQHSFNVAISGSVKGEIFYSLVDIVGTEVFRGSIYKSSFSQTVLLDVSGLRSGNYWLKTSSELTKMNVKPIHVIIAR